MEIQMQLMTMTQPDAFGSQAYQETRIKHGVDFVRSDKKSSHASPLRQ